MTFLARRRRRGPIVVVATILLATACGGAPSRADWIERISDSIGSDITAGLEGRGLTELEARMVIDEFVNCQYDAIRSRPDLVESSYDDPGDATIVGDLSTLAQPCVDDLNAALAGKVDPLPTTTLPVGGGLPVDPATGQTLPPTTAPTTAPAADPTDAVDGTLPDAAFETVPTTAPATTPTTTGA